MSRIIKNKIEFKMFGVPTISDKYDVISGIVPVGKVVIPGQIVDMGLLLNGVGDWTTVSANTKSYGVVMHPNVQLGRSITNTGNVITAEQTEVIKMTGGQAVGICIKGFLSGKSISAVPTLIGADGLLTNVVSGAFPLKNLTLIRQGATSQNPEGSGTFTIWEIEVK